MSSVTSDSYAHSVFNDVKAALALMKTIPPRFLDLSTVLVVALDKCVVNAVESSTKGPGLSPAIVFNNAVGTKWL